MLLTRRAALSTGLLLTGSAVSGCALLPGTEQGDDFPEPDELKGQLRELTRKTGRDAFQEVDIKEGYTAATILLKDGSTQEFTRHSDVWDARSAKTKTLLTSSASRPIAALPIDRLPAFRRAAGSDVHGFTVTVDHAAKVHVTARVPHPAEDYGLRVDGSGRLPKLSIDRPKDVRSMIAEITGTYGRSAARVGSFNGFAHVDLNHADTAAGLRVVRYPNLPPRTSITRETPFDDNLLFDATTFDPTLALQRKKTVAADARVPGKVWQWSFSRPEADADPLVSYSVGRSGPEKRVWIDAEGGVMHVGATGCTPGSDWCRSD